MGVENNQSSFVHFFYKIYFYPIERVFFLIAFLFSYSFFLLLLYIHPSFYDKLVVWRAHQLRIFDLQTSSSHMCVCCVVRWLAYCRCCCSLLFAVLHLFNARLLESFPLLLCTYTFAYILRSIVSLSYRYTTRLYYTLCIFILFIHISCTHSYKMLFSSFIIIVFK